MLTFKTLHIRLMLCFILLCAIASQSATAQTNKPSESADQQAVLKALLQEMRLLRQTLERNSLIGHRSEVLIGRLRAQQDSVDLLMSELEKVRKQLSETASDPAEDAEVLADMQKKVDTGVMDSGQLKLFKAQMKQDEQQRQMLLAREKLLADELENEKSHLGQLKARLDTLELEFEKTDGADKPLPKRKQK